MSLVTEKELYDWTGYSQRAALEKFLKQNRILYHYGKNNRIITSQAAIDQSLGVSTLLGKSSNKKFEL